MTSDTSFLTTIISHKGTFSTSQTPNRLETVQDIRLTLFCILASMPDMLSVRSLGFSVNDNGREGTFSTMTPERSVLQRITREHMAFVTWRMYWQLQKSRCSLLEYCSDLTLLFGMRLNIAVSPFTSAISPRHPPRSKLRFLS
jgi:hypothetical protein